MIIFQYQLHNTDVELCQKLISSMEIPGAPINEEMSDVSKVIWEHKDFIAIQHTDTMKLELYGTKNTNSVKYYMARYPLLEYDDVKVVKTKRWK
jgi:hypothetical protein